MKENKVTLSLNKTKIKEAASMIDLMIANGSLEKDHPMVELMEEIVNECVKIIKHEKK